MPIRDEELGYFGFDIVPTRIVSRAVDHDKFVVHIHGRPNLVVHILGIKFTMQIEYVLIDPFPADAKRLDHLADLIVSAFWSDQFKRNENVAYLRRGVTTPNFLSAASKSAPQEL